MRWRPVCQQAASRQFRPFDETEVDSLPPPPDEHPRAGGLLEFLPPPLPRRRLAVGDVIDGRYRLSKLVRDSTSPRVFLGENVVTGARVWIEHWERSLERFGGQARALASVRHRSVVRLLDALADPAVLVFELLEGESLSRLLAKHGPIEVSRALRIAERICWGLHAAHRVGVAFPQLKASNIVLTADTEMGEEPVLVDFTSAILVAPASALTNRPPGSIADLDCLGRILFQMLTAVRAGAVALRSVRRDIPAQVAKFVDGLLRRPGSFDSAESMATALNQLRRKTSRRTRRWPRTVSVLPAVLAILVVIVFSLLVGSLLVHG